MKMILYKKVKKLKVWGEKMLSKKNPKVLLDKRIKDNYKFISNCCGNCTYSIKDPSKNFRECSKRQVVQNKIKYYDIVEDFSICDF